MNQEMPHPGGRPTKYKEEYCQKVIELSKNGLSLYEIAMELDVNTDSLYEWERKHVQFSDALTRARDYCIAFYYKIGRENLETRTFNSRTHELVFNNLIRAKGNRQLKEALNKSENHVDKCTSILEFMAEGRIEETKALSMVEVIMSTVKIEEHTERKTEIDLINELLNESKLKKS